MTSTTISTKITASTTSSTIYFLPTGCRSPTRERHTRQGPTSGLAHRGQEGRHKGRRTPPSIRRSQSGRDFEVWIHAATHRRSLRQREHRGAAAPEERQRQLRG